MSPILNYRETLFQHPTLTKIAGDPTYTSLAKLERECKANAKSVRSDLGGGAQGHLGLVSTATAYERIAPGTPFVRPSLPILPTIEGTTAVINAARQAYDEQIKAFNDCNIIERTIVQQINTALDNDVLADLIDDATGLLVGTIPEIMGELYDTYGTVTPQSLTAAKSKLESTSYDHSRPIANLFTAINDYANMAEANGATETPVQLINIGLIVLTRASIFASDVRRWQALPESLKSWPTFKKHFRTAQKAIKQSQPIVTTDTLGYHQSANAAAIIDEVVNRITAPSADEESQFSTPVSTLKAAEQEAEQQLQQHLASIAASSNQNQTMMAQI